MQAEEGQYNRCLCPAHFARGQPKRKVDTWYLQKPLKKVTKEVKNWWKIFTIHVVKRFRKDNDKGI